MPDYTIIARGAKTDPMCTSGTFDSDEAAIRWAYYYLGLDRARMAMLYRGLQSDTPDDSPFAEIYAPET